MKADTRPQCEISLLGKKDYQMMHQLQQDLVKKRRENEIKNQLLLVEHPPVLTFGQKAKEANLLVSRQKLARAGIETYQIKRGGDITYHGPGQIVGYPILNLNDFKQDLHWYLRSLEEVFIKLLDIYGIEAERKQGLTGVWVGNNKLVAIGIAVKHWVTYHGFAFNYDPNLDHFNLIHPCGIKDKGVTSLAELITPLPAKREIYYQLISCFKQVFKLEGELIETTGGRKRWQ